MPPKTKVSKENIIEAAFTIARERGFAGVTARSVAGYLGCSVAPIYVNFTTIDELTHAVVRRVFQISEQILERQPGTDIFERIGKSSIEFAREYPVFFRELMLQPNSYMNSYESLEATILESMEEDPVMANWSLDEKRMLLFKLKAFQVGLQVIVANGQLPSWMEDSVADNLLMQVGGELQYIQTLKDSQGRKA